MTAAQKMIERALAASKDDPNELQGVVADAQTTKAKYEESTRAREQLAVEQSLALSEFHAMANQCIDALTMKHTELLSLARAELGIHGDPIEPHDGRKNFEGSMRAAQQLKKVVRRSA